MMGERNGIFEAGWMGFILMTCVAVLAPEAANVGKLGQALVMCREGGIMVQTIDQVQRDKHARNPGTSSRGAPEADHR